MGWSMESPACQKKLRKSCSLDGVVNFVVTGALFSLWAWCSQRQNHIKSRWCVWAGLCICPLRPFITHGAGLFVIPTSRVIELRCRAVEQKPRFLWVVNCPGEISRQVTWLRNGMSTTRTMLGRLGASNEAFPRVSIKKTLLSTHDRENVFTQNPKGAGMCQILSPHFSLRPHSYQERWPSFQSPF